MPTGARPISHKRDGTPRGIGIRDGEGDALPLLIADYNDKMPRLARTGNHRRFHHELHYLLGEVPLFQYLVHVVEKRVNLSGQRMGRNQPQI